MTETEKDLTLVQFKSGDIGLSTSKHWVSKAILWFESIWTKDANFSHAYALVGENLIVEALVKIAVNPIGKYRKQTTDVWRIPITDEERKAFRIGMLRRTNGAYGFLKYPGFILDSAFTWVGQRFGRKKPVFIFSKMLGLSNIPVCSQLVVWGVHKFTSYRFKEGGKEVNWREVNPDRLEDLLKSEENQAERIYSSA